MSDPSFIPELQRFLHGRLAERTEGSYSVRLMSDVSLAQRKLMEEAMEVCLEVQADDVDRGALADEAADLMFHLTALLTGAGVDWSEVESRLRDRHGRPARDSDYPVRVEHTVGTTTVSGTPVPADPDEGGPDAPEGSGRVSFTVGSTTVSGTPVEDDTTNPGRSGR